jgi:hypothetical protein
LRGAFGFRSHHEAHEEHQGSLSHDRLRRETLAPLRGALNRPIIDHHGRAVILVCFVAESQRLERRARFKNRTPP